MKKSLSCVVFAALLLIIPYPINAQHKRANLPLTLGWDLTYSSLLKTNKVNHREWIWKWLGKNYHSPVTRLIAGWQDEPIITSILIEHPAFHAGEHITLWFARTKTRAYYWQFLKGKPHIHIKEPLSIELYDKITEAIFSWQQAEPLKPEDTPKGSISGYCGFLSYYDRGESRQMLLTLKDFFLFDNKNAYKDKPGRLAQVLEPILNKQ